MSKDTSVFDLGELDAPSRFKVFGSEEDAPRGRSARKRAVGSQAFDIRVGPTAAGLATSLSIFLPGTGQLVLGDFAHGLFFLSSIGFLCALGWAIANTFDRLTATLNLFGVPAEALISTLAILFALAAMLHLSGVFHAQGLVPQPKRPRHPVLVGTASLLVPGWGQMLNGCYVKGTLLLGSLWLLAAGWILTTDRALGLLSGIGLSPASLMSTIWWKAGIFAVPAVIWALSVYDAAAYASHRR